MLHRICTTSNSFQAERLKVTFVQFLVFYCNLMICHDKKRLDSRCSPTSERVVTGGGEWGERDGKS